jgi:hypothetical protein
LPCKGLLARIEEIEENDSERSTGQNAFQRNPSPILFQGDGIREFREGADVDPVYTSISSHPRAHQGQFCRFIADALQR